MKKLIALLTFTLMVSGCQDGESPDRYYAEFCYKGVKYLETKRCLKGCSNTTGTTVMFNPETNKPVYCEGDIQ